jgi:hypothetical protein
MNRMDIKPKKKCDICQRRTGWYTRCVECRLHICQACSFRQSGCYMITCYDCQQKHMDKCDECRYDTDTDGKDEDSLICYMCGLEEQHICTDCYKGVCGLHISWCKECEQKVCMDCYTASGRCYQCIEQQSIPNKESTEQQELDDVQYVLNQAIVQPEEDEYPYEDEEKYLPFLDENHDE